MAALTSSSLKSAALLDLMKSHLASPDGEELKTKVGFVYQINIAPKVREACARSPTELPADLLPHLLHKEVSVPDYAERSWGS